jgi:hypothetical protein
MFKSSKASNEVNIPESPGLWTLYIIRNSEKSIFWLFRIPDDG